MVLSKKFRSSGPIVELTSMSRKGLLKHLKRRFQKRMPLLGRGHSPLESSTVKKETTRNMSRLAGPFVRNDRGSIHLRFKQVALRAGRHSHSIWARRTRRMMDGVLEH